MSQYKYTITLTRKSLWIFPIKVEIYADSITDPRFSDLLVLSKHIKIGEAIVCADVAIFNKDAWISIEIEKNTCGCYRTDRPKKIKNSNSTIKSSEPTHS